VVDQWLADQSVPDGVFACSDLVAMGVVSALAARGLSVPADVKLVGFDDVALAAHVHPSLTTVRQDMALAARTLVAVLERQVQGLPDAAQLLPTTLVVRGSSGAAT
jgi:DNA-binding LacI/PurR family transcriptional regulator